MSVVISNFLLFFFCESNSEEWLADYDSGEMANNFDSQPSRTNVD